MDFLVPGFHLAIIEQRIVIGPEGGDLASEVVPLLLCAGQMLPHLLKLLGRRICRDFAVPWGLLPGWPCLCITPPLATSFSLCRAGVLCTASSG